VDRKIGDGEERKQVMQQTEQTAGFQGSGLATTGLAETGLTAGLAVAGRAGSMASEMERKRVEAVVETLADLRGGAENLAEVAHDARNMVTALGLYCDLLEEPGVLHSSFLHYANELRLVATASRRLVEKLVVLDARLGPVNNFSRTTSFNETGTQVAPLNASRLERARHWDLMPPELISNLAGELEVNRNLLSALAGPSITLTVEVEGGALPVELTCEDLTRILVNLVKNAAEAMPDGGRVAIRLHEFHAGVDTPTWLMLTIEDNGPGIPQQAVEKIFESGYSTRTAAASSSGDWPVSHHGLGLHITRSIIETAGGHIHTTHRASAGARFEIELPVRSR
jgi:signal transduction histidine kinase